MMRPLIDRYWLEVARAIESVPRSHLDRAATLLYDCYRRSGTIFVLGNGGSAATASHFVCDLAKGTRQAGQPPFRVIGLSDNMPLITAWANDVSYERVFAEQLAGLVRPLDVVVLISASGNSPNVLAASETAALNGALSVALTGGNGGRLAGLVDLAVRVNARSIEQVEDLHLMIAHSLCVALRARLQAECTATSTTAGTAVPS